MIEEIIEQLAQAFKDDFQLNKAAFLSPKYIVNFHPKKFYN